LSITSSAALHKYYWLNEAFKKTSIPNGVFLYKILPGSSHVCLTGQYDWHRPDWQYLSTNIVMTILGYHIFLLIHMNMWACKNWKFLWTFLWKKKFQINMMGKISCFLYSDFFYIWTGLSQSQSRQRVSQ